MAGEPRLFARRPGECKQNVAAGDTSASDLPPARWPQNPQRNAVAVWRPPLMRGVGHDNRRDAAIVMRAALARVDCATIRRDRRQNAFALNQYTYVSARMPWQHLCCRHINRFPLLAASTVSFRIQLYFTGALRPVKLPAGRGVTPPLLPCRGFLCGNTNVNCHGYRQQSWRAQLPRNCIHTS